MANPNFQEQVLPRIVALGDSVTRGVRPGVTVEQTFESLLEEKLRPKYPGLEVINKAIGSETTRHSWMRLHTAVVTQRPVICTIMFGINDSYFYPGYSSPTIPLEEFRGRLRNFIRYLRAHGIACLLMTSNPMTARIGLMDQEPYASQPKGVNFLLEEYVQAVRELALEEDVPLADVYRAFWEAAKGTESGIDELLTDGCHPNPAGHRIIAECALPLIQPLLSETFSRTFKTSVYDNKSAAERLKDLKFKPCTAYGAEQLTKPIALSLPSRRGACTLLFEARASSGSVQPAWIQLSIDTAEIWVWLSSKGLAINRHVVNPPGKPTPPHVEDDLLEVPFDGTEFHVVRVVLHDLNVAVFVGEEKQPSMVATGWLVPGAYSGTFLRLEPGTGGDHQETNWRRIEMSYGEENP